MANGLLLNYQSNIRRFLFEKSLLKSLIIDGSLFHRIIKVLRMTVGEQFILFDGLGSESIFQIKEISKNTFLAVLVNSERKINIPSLPNVTLGIGILKLQKFDFVIQKCTEIGIRTIIPLFTERTIIRPPLKNQKFVRWNSIAKAAAEQSKRIVIPEVLEAVPFKEYISNLREDHYTIMPYENETNLQLSDVLTKMKISEKGINLIIGPEGGFSSEEVLLAHQKNIKIVTLGSAILKAETAAIVTSALIFSRMGLLG